MLPVMPRLLLCLVASVASLGMGAQTVPPTPRLLVGIIVEGLDNDALELLRDRFGQGGFRLLENGSVVIPAVDYGTYLDAAAATATLVSGAAPSTSGIGGDERYDRDAMRVVATYADPSFIGNFTSASLSPTALRVSTLTDELRIAAGGTNVAYAVAVDPAQALALGGHAANAAVWLDPGTGNWASSTFYKEMPVSVATRNRMSPLSSRLDTMSWVPALQPESYPALPDHLTHYPFRYVFPRGNVDRLDMFMSSPMANREVTSIAGDLIGSQRMGTHEGVTDVLNIAYNLTPYPYGKNKDTRVETMDAYVRLDRDLERLFKTIDKNIGLDKTVIYLAATPPRPYGRRDDERWSIPYGEFSTRKAISLLNMYLIAVYGNGDYVSAYHRGQFFLDHKLLKDKNLDVRDVRRECASFLMRMTGVDRVHTIDEIAAGHAGENAEALRRNTVISSAGDVMIELAPGFELLDDFNTIPSSTRTVWSQRVATSTAPVFIKAPGVTPQTIGTPVDVRAIAPTVSRILRIRSPNGAAAAPLYFNK